MDTITAEIRADGDRIELDATVRDRDYVKQIPGHRFDGDRWHLPLSWSACKALRGVFGDRLEIGSDLWAWAMHEYAHRVEPALRLRHQTDAEGPDELRTYQRVGVKFLETAREALLADDMGTGKTVQTAVALRNLHESGVEVFPAVVVCPAGVKQHWVRELAKWFPEARAEAVTGYAKSRRDTLERLAEGELDLITINWEVLRKHSRLAPYGSVRLRRCEECDPENSEGKRQASCHRCPKELNEIEFRTVVADEVHRAKNPKSQQTRAWWSLAHQETVNVRLGLTGTPIADAIDDLWSIMHGIAPDEYPTKTDFIERYAMQSWNAFGGMEIVGIRADTRDEFFSFFDPRFIRRPKEAVLPELPAKTYLQREIPMAAKQRKLYRQLADEMIARLDDGETLAVFDPLTQTTRLNQAAASCLEAHDCEDCDATGVRPDYHRPQPHPDPDFSDAWCYCAELVDAPVHEEKCRSCNGRGLNYVPSLPSNKIDELLEIMEETGDDQLVVFAVSRKLIELAAERIEAKTDAKAVQITGAVPQNVRDLNVGEFKRGEARLALCTIAAAGEGLDGLQVADTVVFLQRHYSRLLNQQAEDRIHRMGQDSDKVVVIDVISEDTIEWDKDAVLAQKEGRFEELVRDEETLRRLLTDPQGSTVEES